jgi:small subunit ribosomal protein S20
MPIIKSAKKALRQNLKRQAKNKIVRQKVKTVLKDARTLAGAKKGTEAQKSLSMIYKTIDKAAKKGIMKPNTAARKKSRIAKLIAKSLQKTAA